MNPFSNGIRVDMPGNPELSSAMVAMPLLVALRPVSSDERDGEHSAVVWKFENFTPMSAMRCMFGVATGPPNTSIVPYPTSSHARNRTFGEPSGAFGARYGSQSGTESRTSTAILPLNSGAMCTSPNHAVAGPRRLEPCHRTQTDRRLHHEQGLHGRESPG